MPIVAAIAAVVLCGVTYGQSRNTRNTTGDAKLPQDIEWGPAVDGYRIGIHFDEHAFKHNGQLDLSIWLKHDGPDEVRIPISSAPLSPQQLEVLLPSGQRATLTTLGKKVEEDILEASYSISAINPGGTHSAVLQDFSRIFDMSASGTYTITARRVVWARDSMDKTVELKSNVLKVQVP